ncbi:MAG TPA: EamA family transporter [Sphingobium sp.]|nr:EamA family transporter [Sphingobium sp.]
MVFLLILVSVAMSSLAQLILKFGMASAPVQRVIGAGDALPIALTVGMNPLVVVGLALYFLSAVVWLFVLSRIELSTAYPFVALGFVFTALLARIFIGESFTPAKIIGTILIIAGVLIVARGTPMPQ